MSRLLLAAALVAACEASQRTSGQFTATLSGQLQKLGEGKVSTVACIGPRNSGKGGLLSSLLGTTVPDVEAGVATAVDEERGVAVLNTEGFGERLGSASAADDATGDTAVAVALSDVVVLSVFFREFISDPADAVGSLSELRPSLEIALKMARESGAKAPRKRPLFLVVRDFEADEGVTTADVAAQFSSLLDSMWVSLAHLPMASGLKPSDVLQVQVVALPPSSAGGFADAADGLKAKLSKASDAAAPASKVLASLVLAQRIADQAASDVSLDAGPEDFTQAAACARAASEVFEEYVAASSSLHDRAGSRDRREPLPTLGSEGSVLLNAALDSFDTRTAAYNGTLLCDKRRSYLQTQVLADLRPLHTSNLQLAVKQAVVDFARRSANISTAAAGPSGFDGQLEAVVSQTLGAFKAKADALKVPEAGSAWTSGLEERMLMQELQTLSAEMIRRAQLNGLYTPAPGRVPTGVALHWLHPNPFGKDARRDSLTASDRLAYSERAKELLRSSPMRVSPNQGNEGSKLTASAFSGGIKLSDDDLVIKDEKRR